MEIIEAHLGFDKDQKEIREDYIYFTEMPTKEQLDDIHIPKVYFNFNVELDDYEYLKHSNITHILFGKNFDQSIENLPIKLTHLRFGEWDDICKFNNDIDNLPIGLEELCFSEQSWFNKKINKLPAKLKKLKLGNNFNQSLDNLPKYLEKLEIYSFTFDFKLNNLPNSLKILDLDGKYNKTLDFLPNSLCILRIPDYYNKPLNNLPNNLEELTIENYEYSHNLHNLPNSLKKLIISKRLEKQVKLPKDCVLDIFYN